MKTILSTILALCAVSASAQTATFEYFSYQGNDSRFEKQIDESKEYYNPVVAGFYPDPSICRVGDTFYLTNSSFGYFPGVPIFTSKDLINWQPMGYVLDREEQVRLGVTNVSAGVFAPDIKYCKKNKTYYMITKNTTGGNYYVKSQDPAKGWSDPIYLRKIIGIDPAFFFDDNGDAYIIHNAQVSGKPDYEGQRAIKIARFDIENDCMIGKSVEIIRGGSACSENPVWIEGPHIYRIGKYYYLMCAEGGTDDQHAEVIFRASVKSDITKPESWEDNPDNPILTQRSGLDPNRQDAVTCTGHADLVQAPSGDWWAVFLGSRPYDGLNFSTGRETFLLPVTWKNGWPVILEKDQPVPTVVQKQKWQQKLGGDAHKAVTGNIRYTDRFEGSTLDYRWVYMGNPTGDFLTLTPKGLQLQAKAADISGQDSPSAIFCRQQNTDFTAETAVSFVPQKEGELAGMVHIQNIKYKFVFGKTILNGQPRVVLTRSDNTTVTIASAPLSASETQQTIRLKVDMKGRYCDFLYAVGSGDWQILAQGVDAINLSTPHAGGCNGSMIGLYATTVHSNQ